MSKQPRHIQETTASSVQPMRTNPFGRVMTADELPPPGTQRWVTRRKAEVVAGVRAGVISLDEACRRYTLSVDEYRSWERLLDDHGIKGLRVTRLKEVRANERGKDATEVRPLVAAGPARSGG